ncbi:ABC transporter permease [bacterium]|nr:ABC transporter permease [bacterium]
MSSQTALRACVSILLVLLLAIVLAPILGPESYETIDLGKRLLPPSSAHWFGTDELGRDVFLRLLHGGRISFLVSLIVVTISFVTGVLLGSVAAWSGPLIDESIMRLADILLAFPGLLLAIALMAVLGPSLQNVILALIVIGWIPYARLSRALVLKFRELEFVHASRSLGATSERLWLHHIFPNMLPTLFVQVSFSFAGMILAESSLSFLGLGVQPPEPSWGNMLSDAKNHLMDAPYLTIFPGLAIFISVLSFNLVGDSLRDRFDPFREW